MKLERESLVRVRFSCRAKELTMRVVCRALQSFLQTNEGSVKATYVIQGQLSQARAASGHSDPMDLNAPAESLETSLLLVGQDKLGSEYWQASFNMSALKAVTDSMPRPLTDRLGYRCSGQLRPRSFVSNLCTLSRQQNKPEPDYNRSGTALFRTTYSKLRDKVHASLGKGR